MNLRDLQYLVAMADYGHMGKASVACNVSQPTMSMQLKKLESWLGVALFERRQKSMHLTAEGLMLANRARSIMQEAEALVAHAKTLRDPMAGEFRLGAFPTLAPYYLPSAVPRIAAEFPKITLLLLEDKSERLLEQLRTGALDAALLALPVTEKGLLSIPLFCEPFTLAVSRTNPLARKKWVEPCDVVKENMLLLEDGHCLRDQALDVCSVIGTSEHTGFRATSLETLRQMVSMGNGVTLMPACASIDTQQVVHIPFMGAPYTRQIGLVFRDSSPRAVLIQAMASVLQTNKT